jgi:hypothetical protein
MHALKRPKHAIGQVAPAMHADRTQPSTDGSEALSPNTRARHVHAAEKNCEPAVRSSTKSTMVVLDVQDKQ